MKNLLKLSCIAIVAALFFASCEGPEGPAGEDGLNASAECMACHNDGTALKAKQLQFEESAHSMGTRFDETGECSGCHSNEGFLARKDFTAMSEIYDLDLTDQTPISCRTCHNVHMAYDSTDWELTFADQVTETLMGTKSPLWASSSFEDKGSSNLCLQCHQSRDKENIPDVSSTADVNVYKYWGPHYGVQGNIAHSNAGVHIAGSATYPTTAFKHDCMKCHMNEGDHSLEVNFDACTQCHSDIEDDIDAIQTEVHEKLFSLGKSLALLGVMSPDVEGTDTVGYHPAGGYSGVDISADHARAVYNYMVVAEDHSYGVHNPDYIKALLDNTIESL